MSDLERRRCALEKTLTKYRKRRCDFVWADCARMLRFHLLAMGHKPKPLPSYRSATGALRALRQVGGIAGVLDDLGLPRIPWARMLPGDVAVMAGEDGTEAGVICVGFKVCGWVEGLEEMVNMTPLDVVQAWRA